MKPFFLRIIKYITGSKGSGILLIAAVIISMSIANSSCREGYLAFFNAKAGFTIGPISLYKSVTHWINDLLMAVFFLLVGLEVKREIIKGELASWRKAVLPLAAAIGGILMPVLIYMLLNYHNPETVRGWAVPMATDIAFALSILALAGNVVYPVRIFLTSLAIADDIGAVLVIAFFYSTGLSFYYLGLAALVMLGLFVINRLKVQNLAWYLLPGLALWYFVYKSGIHATIAGVLLALTIPVSSKVANSPLEKLENALYKPVGLFIIPVFALANTAIDIDFDYYSIVTNPASIGIIVGLVVGKFAGIGLATLFTIKMGAGFPEGFTWKHVTGIGFLGGVGFTMSIFIALLAFDAPVMQELSKVSILLASLVSGLLGFFILRSMKGPKRSTKANQ